MLKNILYFGACTFLFLPAILMGLQDKNTLAVLELEELGISRNEGRMLVNRLRNEIATQGHYLVIERELIEEILREQDFSQSGCTSSDCLVEIGKLLNVDYILGGSIGQVGSTYSISVRMINVETGIIYRSADYDYTGSIDNLLKIGMRNASKKLLSDDFVDRPMQGTKINTVANNSLINTWRYSNKMLSVRFKNGSIIKGKIISVDSQNNVSIQTLSGYQISIPSNDIIAISPLNLHEKGSVGLGVGLAYGGIGLSVDLALGPRFALCGGYGTFPVVEEPGFGAGIRYYFTESSRAFRPRISILYGTNMIFYYSESGYSYDYYSGDYDYYDYEITELLQGYEICLGFEIAFGDSRRHGIDFDIAYIPGFSDKLDETINKWEEEGYEITEYQEGIPIDISIGYRFRL